MLELDYSVDETENHTSPLERSYTFCNAVEIVPVTEEPEEPDRSQSTKTLAACISIAEGDEWSALEGATRVNSILNIPRSLISGKRSTHRAN